MLVLPLILHNVYLLLPFEKLRPVEVLLDHLCLPLGQSVQGHSSIKEEGGQRFHLVLGNNLRTLESRRDQSAVILSMVEDSPLWFMIQIQMNQPLPLKQTLKTTKLPRITSVVDVHLPNRRRPPLPEVGNPELQSPKLDTDPLLRLSFILVLRDYLLPGYRPCRCPVQMFASVPACQQAQSPPAPQRNELV